MKNKADWKNEKLGNVCEILNGFAFKSSNYVDEGIRVIRITNVQKGKIVDNSPQFYPLNSNSELLKFKLFESDLLLSLTGNVGRVGLLTKDLLPAALNQRVACIRIKDESVVSTVFLYQFMNSDLFESICMNSAQGIAQKNLSTEWLKNYIIPIPPISTQHQIITELEVLSDIITKKKQQLEELDKLAQATFYDMFGDLFLNDKGWKFEELNKICTEIVDCPHSTPKKSEIPTQFPCIRTSELKKGQIEWKSMQYVDYLEYENRVKRLVPKMGDIVYGREGSYGDAVCLPDSHNFCLGQRTMLFRPKTEIIDSIFLLHTVISEFVYSQAKKKNSGSTVGHVNVSDIKKFSIPIPPLNFQTQFSQKIESIENQKVLINQSINDVQQLFDYTMYKYFN